MFNHVNIEFCPICNEKTQRLNGFIDTYIRVSDQVVTSHFRYCNQCDFSFMENPFDTKGMELYYSNNDQLRRNGLTSEESYHINQQVNFIERNMKKESDSILEIGADNGMFLELAILKTGCEGYFIEFNAEAVSHLENKGFKNALKCDESYDAIIIRHTLEHIVDPLSYLCKLKNNLNKDSVVFIEVPDYTVLSSGFSDTFQLEHVNYFTLSSMSRLANMSGYALVSSEIVRTPGYSTTPNSVLRVILKNTDNKGGIITNNYEEWESLLNSNLKLYDAIDTVIQKYNSVAIYGAGTRTIEYLASRSGSPVSIIYDGDQKKSGTNLFGIDVYHSEELNGEDFDALIVLVVGYEKEVLEFLESKNIESKKIITINLLVESNK